MWAGSVAVATVGTGQIRLKRSPSSSEELGEDRSGEAPIVELRWSASTRQPRSPHGRHRPGGSVRCRRSGWSGTIRTFLAWSERVTIAPVSSMLPVFLKVPMVAIVVLLDLCMSSSHLAASMVIDRPEAIDSAPRRGLTAKEQLSWLARGMTAQPTGEKVVTPLLRLSGRGAAVLRADQSIEDGRWCARPKNRRQGECGEFDRTDRPATEFDGDTRPPSSAADGFGIVITRRSRGPFTFIVGRSLEMRPLGPCLHDHRHESGAEARRSELQRPARSRSNFDDEGREDPRHLVQSRPSTRRLQLALPLSGRFGGGHSSEADERCDADGNGTHDGKNRPPLGKAPSSGRFHMCRYRPLRSGRDANCDASEQAGMREIKV
ncbi:hypothetical protein ABIE89_000045 [Bradyrhizobium niftali]